MSATYQSIIWNRQKRIYDGIMLGGIVLFLGIFIGLTVATHPDITGETLVIRASGSLAILMLHIILMIGPLSRLDKRFLPILYNRRHLGVTMFLFALIHGAFSILQFHSLGDTNALVSLFTANADYTSLSGFPFQVFGFFALIILFLMAATSHDFWLGNLSPKIWKGLHMLVYAAYVMLVMHIMLGVIQLENSSVFVVLLGIGMLAIISLHLVAGRNSQQLAAPPKLLIQDGFIEVCTLDEIENNRAKLVTVGTESIAIYKYDGKLSAVNNFCKHQNGPLSEGKIIDGCITCPWHGYQYYPESGSSPPPFTEKVSTYTVRVNDGKVWINPEPKPERTKIEPAVF